MRRYALALQLVVLICCAVASGYLWRAALGTGRAIRYVSAGTPYSPAWPAPEAPGRVTVTHVPKHEPATSLGRAARTGLAARSAVATAGLSSKTSHPATSSPAATTVGDQTPPPQSPPASPPPQSPPPSPPPPSPPSPPAPPPTPPPPPAPPPSPPPPASPPTRAVSVVRAPANKGGERPGWGKGDRNHDHTGPPATPPPPPPPPTPPAQPQPPQPQTPADPPKNHGHEKK
jgi:hypothetical protein